MFAITIAVAILLFGCLALYDDKGKVVRERDELREPSAAAIQLRRALAGVQRESQ